MKSSNSLFIIDNESNFAHRKLTAPTLGISDHSPKFSYDGEHVFFLSNRNGSSQIFVVPSDGSDRDVVQLTNFPISITSFKVSKNFIMFSADIYLSCDDFECTAQKNHEAAQNPNAGVVYDSLFIRHWDTYKTPGKVSHVFLHKIERSGMTWRLSGSPIDVMRNLNADSPVPPFGGNDHYDISPTEAHVAFTAALVTHDSSWNTGWKTYIVNISNFPYIDEPLLVDKNKLARTQNPVFSKSGKFLAYLSMDRPGYEADRLHLVTYNIATKNNTPITNHIDMSLGGIAWSASDDVIFADLDFFGNHPLIAINLSSRRVQMLVQSGTVSTPVVLNNNKVVYTRNDHLGPNEIYTFKFNGQSPSPVKITQVNPDFAQLYELRPADRFSFTSTGNVTVYGYFFYPYRWKRGTEYPIVQLIHGGPQGSWTNSWSTRWNPQLFAANGYAVVTIDPRGSTGYGQNFTDAVNGDWGGRPFEDLMNGLDYVLRRYEWTDANRQFACGASYGGYMINWIQGNTNRYKALVNHDGIFDLLSAYYSTEELWFFEWEFGVPPYVNDTLYNKWTPSQYVSRWNTPMLIIHGSQDFRIDETQGIAAFTALQRRGIESRFLLFPEENHWVLNPLNSIQWYKEVLGWLDEHL